MYVPDKQSVLFSFFQMSGVGKLWHDERNVIITANESVDAEQLFQHLKDNMHSYPDGSQFFFVTGHHHNGQSKVGKPDPALFSAIASGWEQLHKKCKKDKNCSPKCDNCVWQSKKFQLDMPHLQTNDFDTEGVYKLADSSLDILKTKFNNLCESKDSIVLVYFSCWSHYSPINTILQALGLYAVLALKKEKSDLTIERVFKLNNEQQEYLKMVVDDPMIDGRLITKDLIIAGKYHLCLMAYDNKRLDNSRYNCTKSYLYLDLILDQI